MTALPTLGKVRVKETGQIGEFIDTINGAKIEDTEHFRIYCRVRFHVKREDSGYSADQTYSLYYHPSLLEKVE